MDDGLGLLGVDGMRQHRVGLDRRFGAERLGEVRSVPEGWILSGEPPSSARPGANPRLA
ncbi:MAG: hypothetical protein M3Y09_20340 [Actinomycetota bacterium]|nr:hypothetical protein [Actinomycetota bacterium]